MDTPQGICTACPEMNSAVSWLGGVWVHDSSDVEHEPVVWRRPHPLATRWVRVRLLHDRQDMPFDGLKVKVLDWWMNLHPQSWMWAKGNAAAMVYAIRMVGVRPAHIDDEVVYVKVQGVRGEIIHVTELGETCEPYVHGDKEGS